MTSRRGEWSIVGDTTRQRVRDAALPVARALSALGFSADALTIMGFLVSVGAGVVCATGLWVPAGVAVAFGGVFDLFDGAVARVRGTASPLGSFLDSTFDRLSDAVIYIGCIAGVLGPGAASIRFATLGDRSASETLALVAIIALAASQTVSYTRARAQGIGLDAAVGVAPRAERVVLLTVGLLLQPATGWALGVAFTLIALLSLITVAQRIFHVRRLASTTTTTT
jgi:CDP-diacylglycerol--glycerol-3-phosphate 3-phosphatidyltransferase